MSQKKNFKGKRFRRSVLISRNLIDIHYSVETNLDEITIHILVISHHSLSPDRSVLIFLFVFYHKYLNSIASLKKNQC